MRDVFWFFRAVVKLLWLWAVWLFWFLVMLVAWIVVFLAEKFRGIFGGL